MNRLLASSASINIGGMAIGLALNILLARCMNTYSFGSWSLIYSSLLIAAPICCLGLDRLILTEGPRIQTTLGTAHAARFLRTSVSVIAWFSCAISAACTLSAVAAGAKGEWIAASLCIPLAALSTYSIMALRCRQLVLRSQLQDQLIRPAMLFAIATFFCAGGWATPMALIVGLGTVFAIGLAMVWRLALPTPVADEIAAQIPWGRARKLWGATALLFAASRIDLFIIGFFFDTSQVAAFHVCSRLAALTGTGAVLLNMTVGSHVANLVAQGRTNDAQLALRRSVRSVGAITLAGMLALSLRPELILGIFGEEYTHQQTVLQLLMFGQLVNVCTGPSGMVLQIYHLERFALLAISIGIVSGTAISLLLIPYYGLVGPAVGATASTMITQIITWRIAVRLTPVDPSVIGRVKPSQGA